MRVTFRPSSLDDLVWLMELRAEVLRPDLTRLGRYDPVRVRERFQGGFVPENTSIILVDGEERGCVSVRPESDALWIEHFYLAAAAQGQGVGTVVLDSVLRGLDPRPFRLNVLQGSRARSLYESRGFILDTEDEVDVFMTRAPGRGKAAIFGDGAPLRR